MQREKCFLCASAPLHLCVENSAACLTRIDLYGFLPFALLAGLWYVWRKKSFDFSQKVELLTTRIHSDRRPRCVIFHRWERSFSVSSASLD